MLLGFTDIPDDYLRALGLVVVRWSYLEGILDLSLIKLLGKSINEGRSFVVFAHMAFPQKLDVLGALISEVALPEQAPLRLYKKDIQPLLKKAQESRNALLHSKWISQDGFIMTSSLSARGSLKLKGDVITVEGIEHVCEDIVHAADTLYEAIVASSSPQSGQ